MTCYRGLDRLLLRSVGAVAQLGRRLGARNGDSGIGAGNTDHLDAAQTPDVRVQQALGCRWDSVPGRCDACFREGSAQVRWWIANHSFTDHDQHGCGAHGRCKEVHDRRRSRPTQQGWVHMAVRRDARLPSGWQAQQALSVISAMVTRSVGNRFARSQGSNTAAAACRCEAGVANRSGQITGNRDAVAGDGRCRRSSPGRIFMGHC